MYSGQRRRIGFAFLYPESATTVRSAGRFFLWAGRFIGEATVVTGVLSLKLPLTHSPLS